MVKATVASVARLSAGLAHDPRCLSAPDAQRCTGAAAESRSFGSRPLGAQGRFSANRPRAGDLRPGSAPARTGLGAGVARADDSGLWPAPRGLPGCGGGRPPPPRQPLDPCLPACSRTRPAPPGLGAELAGGSLHGCTRARSAPRSSGSGWSSPGVLPPARFSARGGIARFLCRWGGRPSFSVGRRFLKHGQRRCAADESQLGRPRELLERVFPAHRAGLVGMGLAPHQAHRPATAGVGRTFPRIMRGDPLSGIDRPAAVERAITAAHEVDPGRRPRGSVQGGRSRRCRRHGLGGWCTGGHLPAANLDQLSSPTP
jgi:hypothetical protein